MADRPANLPASAAEAAEKRSFTGSKLDWMAALSADPRIDARAFEVGFQIAQHLNMKKGVAFVSDDTITDKTGIPRRWVQRARADLKLYGWIGWERTRTANIYWTLGDNLNPVLDHQVMLKDARDERRSRRKSGHRVAPPMAHLKGRDTPALAHQVAPPVAEQDAPPMANRHLRGNTVVATPSEERHPRKEE